MIESTCHKCHQTYLKHPRAKLNLCCRCRPKRTKKARVLPIDNLAPNALKTDDELAEYFEHDELECLICHERHAGLYRHVLLAHGVKTRDYKIRFGIPITYGLVGKATKVKMQSSSGATQEKMRASGFENLKKARAARGNSRMAWPTYHRHAHVAKMVESQNHPSKMEGMDILYCKCGGEVYVPAAAALPLQCRVRCETCKG